MHGDRAESGSSHAFILDLVGRDKRVLDVGCATGFMAKLLAANGCRVTGIDVDPEAIESARAFCDEVVSADLDVRGLSDILPPTTFEAIVFGDVLEHLRRPDRLLDEARGFIAPGGFAVLSIPNVAHAAVRLALLDGTFDYQELGILDNTHLRFFTIRSVRELCLRAGYRIEVIERTKVPLFHPTDVVPAIDEKRFDRALLERVTSDPEHDTLQFVIRASPLSDKEKFHVAIDCIFEIEAKNEALAANLTEIERRTADYEAIASDRLAVREEIERLRGQLSATQVALDRKTIEFEVIETDRIAVRTAYEAAEVDRTAARTELRELRASLQSARLHESDISSVMPAFDDLFTAYMALLNRDIHEIQSEIDRVRSSKFWKFKLALTRISRMPTQIWRRRRGVSRS